MEMKKKTAAVILGITLLGVCLVVFSGSAAAGDQVIRGKADAVVITSPASQEIASENTTSVNQTEELRNPTFKEMKEFILKDTTSQKPFITNKYECRHFATDVNNNADAAGLRCAFALLCYTNGQHAVVAFETTDRGLIFIEPQTDAAIQPKVGGWYQGQQIVEILVSW
jgi:hypothetical protein